MDYRYHTNLNRIEFQVQRAISSKFDEKIKIYYIFVTNGEKKFMQKLFILKKYEE